MMKPASIRAVETEATKAISVRAFAAQTDSTLTDEQADAIIADCNRQLTAAGMPSGGLKVSRAQYRAGRIS